MNCWLVSVLMKTTLISKVAVLKMSSVYDDNSTAKLLVLALILSSEFKLVSHETVSCGLT